MSLPASVDARVASGVSVAFEADRLLYQVKSIAHEKAVIENAQFGRMMVIDGNVQISSADQFISNEMFSHVPLLAHGRVERVLILGGGDGGLATEVLKHQSVRRVLQVESDPQVVRLARTYFGGISARAFRDPRFQLRVADAAAYVAATNERFDLVLVDSRDSAGPTAQFCSEDFYRNARGSLRSGGLLLARVGAPFLQPLQFAEVMRRLSTLFPVVSTYLVPAPSVLGGPLAFGWASSALSPRSIGSEQLAARFAAANVETRYYTPEIHRAAFALPRYVQEIVDGATTLGIRRLGKVLSSVARDGLAQYLRVHRSQRRKPRVVTESPCSRRDAL